MVTKTCPKRQDQKNDHTSGINPAEASANDLTGNELPQRGWGDHNLVECLFVQALYIQCLCNRIEASIHGCQGNYAWN